MNDIRTKTDKTQGETMDYESIAETIGYKPYTTEYDRVVDITELVDNARVEANSRVLSKYAAGELTHPPQNLQEESLMASARTGIGGLDHLREFFEGMELVEFRLREQFDVSGIDPADTSVTFLIENSGSTRGQTGVHTAMATVELVEALAAMGVETSVLGYTTKSWYGSDSGEKWHRDGKAENSGRIEDLLHIVFKQAGEAYDHASASNIRMLADDKLKRENVNGEGLAWGATSAAASERPSKLLVHVIHKHESHSNYTVKGDQNAHALFQRHFDAVVTEIDQAHELAMTTVKLGQVSCYPAQPERADFPGEVPVIHAADLGAGSALEAFVSGTIAAIERAAALEHQAALVR
jgi:cobaltochelatase CobT